MAKKKKKMYLPLFYLKNVNLKCFEKLEPKEYLDMTKGYITCDPYNYPGVIRKVQKTGKAPNLAQALAEAYDANKKKHQFYG